MLSSLDASMKKRVWRGRRKPEQIRVKRRKRVKPGRRKGGGKVQAMGEKRLGAFMLGEDNAESPLKFLLAWRGKEVNVVNWG